MVKDLNHLYPSPQSFLKKKMSGVSGSLPTFLLGIYTLSVLVPLSGNETQGN